MIPVPHSKTPRASVIIVTWNGLTWTQNCLKSLTDQTEQEAEVIVVDNASTDGTVEWVRANVPDCRVIASKTNTFFAGGNNLGAALAFQHNSPLLLLLNNDAEASPTWIETMCRAAETYKEFGVFGSTLYDLGTDTLQDTGGSLTPKGRTTTHKEPLNHPLEQRDWATGAALGIRADIYKDLNGLDESYGMYFEDVDFCVRAANDGSKTGVLRDAEVWHKKSATSSSHKALWSLAAHLRFADLHLPPQTAREIRRSYLKQAARDLINNHEKRGRTGTLQKLYETRSTKAFSSHLLNT